MPRTSGFAAIVLTALALVPVGAHLFELPNKINLPEHEYFIVQSIYRGWALLGAVLIVATLADAWLAYVSRSRRPACLFAAVGAACLAATLIIFFVWVFPGNQATANWTVPAGNWQTLRSNWEYGHAASAVLTFAALCAVTLSALSGASASALEP